MSVLVALWTDYLTVAVTSAPILDRRVMMDLGLVWRGRDALFTGDIPYLSSTVITSHLTIVTLCIFPLERVTLTPGEVSRPA
ncbi:hypothetical protein TP44_04385 [Xanthomonas citri pv. citri]|nr:hypothetical protein TP44_04385 [Xanthomonas citri pv. citri]